MSIRMGRSEFRLEDEPLVRGRGRYTGDRYFDGEATMVVVRSPFASGRIVELDVEAARQAPGVLAVLTADDLPSDIRPFRPLVMHPGPDGGEMHVPPYYPLTRDHVRYVGDPVAAVVAETKAEAEAAAELVMLDIDAADAVVGPEQATAEGAPSVWPDCPGNLCFRVEKGDRQAVERAFAEATHIVRQRLEISRVTAAPIETRNAVALFDHEQEGFTLRLGTQSPHRMAEGLAGTLGIPPDRMRVISEDTGGAFGMKNTPYPEYVLLLVVAKALGRPVRWRATRLESFLSDSHSREQVMDAALALDGEGRFLALDVRSAANVGAYLGPMSGNPMVNNIGGLAGVYRTPAISVVVDGIFTNTQNMSPYRGAGRPEATYAIERLADLAARDLGLDPAEIRRRNMIRPDEMPYKTPLTFTYDCGDFSGALEQALREGEWRSFPQRRDAAAARGMLRGIGVASPIEIAGGPPGAPPPEYARVGLGGDGRLTVALGSGDTGQGHFTTFGRIFAERLGVALQDIEFVRGDTSKVAKGVGTFGSRSSAALGTALHRATELFIEKGRQRSAELLEAAPDDVEFGEGAFRIVGTDRSISLQDLAASGGALDAEDFSATSDATYPNGCHVCEVEIDPETGAVEICRYTVVDDVGTVLNHMLMEGQIHGGIVQGAGQALTEQMLYDPEDGQLITASFQDYAMPRASAFPGFDVASRPVPTQQNPLGAKGAGEAGVVGALPAVMNAVCDALAPLGIRHLDMPATPHRIWSAIQAARRQED